MKRRMVMVDRRSAAALRCVLLAAGLAVVGHGGPGITAIGPVRRQWFRRLAGYGVAGHVALTFDDGPDPRWTPRFLRLLDDRGVRATFFLLGTMTAASPGLAREIAAAGHEIAVHGLRHRLLTMRGPGAAADDLARACDVVASATGTTPRFFRPPYGVLTGEAILAARRLRLRPLLWTRWGREWTPGSTVESVYRTVLGGWSTPGDGAAGRPTRGPGSDETGSGDTVLLHDSDAASPRGSAGTVLAALPLLLDEWARRGLVVGTAGEHGVDGVTECT